VPRSAHEPEQSMYGSGHVNVQEPAKHTSPAAQAVPQAPQFAGSFCRFLHTPEQSV